MHTTLTSGSVHPAQHLHLEHQCAVRRHRSPAALLPIGHLRRAPVARYSAAQAGTAAQPSRLRSWWRRPCPSRGSPGSTISSGCTHSRLVEPELEGEVLALVEHAAVQVPPNICSRQAEHSTGVQLTRTMEPGGGRVPVPGRSTRLYSQPSLWYMSAPHTVEPGSEDTDMAPQWRNALGAFPFLAIALSMLGKPQYSSPMQYASTILSQ